MSNKFSLFAFRAGKAVASAASKTTDFVQTHKPSDEDMIKAKALVTKAGKAVANEAMTLGKDVVQSKHFKDAVKGAGVGAVVAVPVPLIGPGLGAAVGAGMGMCLGSKSPAPPPWPYVTDTTTFTPGTHHPHASTLDVQAAPPLDLHTELLKLADLRDKGLRTPDEFEVQKQKLLKKV